MHARFRSFAFVSALALALTACGAVVSPTGDGGTDAPTTATDAPTTSPDAPIGCGDSPGGACVSGTPGGACGDAALPMVCSNGAWRCPAGTIPLSQCRCVGRPPGDCVCTDSGWQCAIDAGTTTGFACGDRICEHGAEYCAVILDDTGGPNIYRCNALPPACNGAASCACVTGTSPGNSCTESPDGDVTLTSGGG